jgi:maleate cis-trans isomerase
MNWEDSKPKRVIGTLTPLNMVEFIALEFYRIAPPGAMAFYMNMGVEKFSAEDVERAFKPVESMVETMVSRECDIIVQSGVPLPILIGVAAHDKLMDRIAKASGTPVSSSVTAVAKAARHLGIKKIALGNKWSDEMNACLGEFLAREGVGVAGVCSESMTPDMFLGMDTQKGMDLAYELGKTAITQNPSCDGLYVGGGAWLALPVVEFLEKEFDLPCISNQDSVVWDTLHQVDFWTPTTVSNRLMAGT